MMIEEINKLCNSVYKELTCNILPFWMHKTVDKEFGGFYGQINGYGEVIAGAEKGGILNARILWTFSAAYNHFKDPDYRKLAEYGKQYALKHFFDETYEGIYWKITGNCLIDKGYLPESLLPCNCVNLS